MRADLLREPVRLETRRTHYLAGPKRLICPAGHALKLQPILLGPMGLACPFVHPPRGPQCAVAGYYVLGRTGRVWLVEASQTELLYIQLHGMAPDAAWAWLGITPPPGFVPA